MGFFDGLGDIAQKAIKGIVPVYGAVDNFLNQPQQAAPPDPGFKDRINQMVGYVPGAQAAMSELNKQTSEDHWYSSPLKFTLDFGMQATDTVANVASHAGSTGIGEALNSDSWAKAWGSFGQPGHVSAGDIVANSMFGDDGLKYLDPMDAKNAQAIQANAHDTWYGDIVGGMVDVGAGFVGPGKPIGMLAKGARAGRAVKSAEQADSVHNAFMSALQDGTLDTLKVDKAGDFARGFVGSTKDSSAESMAARLHATAASLTGITDLPEMMHTLSPWLENSTDATKNTIANIMVEANKQGGTLAEETIVNSLLGAMGSTSAKAALAESAPLVAKGLENAMTGPKAAQAADILYNAKMGNKDLTVNDVLEQVYGTASDAAEMAARQSELAAHVDDLAKAHAMAADVRAAKPDAFNFDSARLKDTRLQAEENVRRLTAKLEDAKAGGSDDLAASVKADLEQAKSDRDLYNSTPMKNQDELDAWRSQMDDATAVKNDASMSKRLAEADIRTRAAALKAQQAEMAELRPGLSKLDDFIGQMYDLVPGSLVGDVAPSRLASMKTAWRKQVGDSMLVPGGAPFNARHFLNIIPDAAHAFMGIASPRSRGGINLTEMDKGYREITESMKRSGVFTPEEIQAHTNALLAAPIRADKGRVVEKVQDQMLARIAAKFKDANGNPLDADGALRLIGAAKKGYGDGMEYLTKADQAATGRVASFIGPDGYTQSFNAAHLHSHLQDTAPFIDPHVFERAVKAQLGDAWAKTGIVADDLNSITTALWKHAALIRPGLAVRAMLDTELRAVAMIGAATQFINGTNATLKAAARATHLDSALAQVGVDNAKFQTMGRAGVKIDTGRGEWATLHAYSDDADEAAKYSAMTGGANPSTGLIGQTQKYHDRLVKDNSKWDIYKADSREWTQAYTAHAQVLLNSPAIRKAIADMDLPPLKSPDELEGAVRNFMSDPAIRKEYGDVARPQGWSQADFFHIVNQEVDTMFPTSDIARTVMDGKVGKGAAARKFFDENFPLESRPDVPGPESFFEPNNLSTTGKNVVQKIYVALLDKPDFWMARHPVYTTMYERGVKAEAESTLAARRAKYGDDAYLDANDIRTIDNRAKTLAISSVRRTFFDSARYTGAHAVLGKIAPFFNAWEDASSSWSRLIYDNPNRMSNLAGAWNIPSNLNVHIPEPIFVDGNGKSLQPGEEVPNGGQKYIALPIKVPGMQSFRFAQSSVNSISMGEVPWLPGFGPVASLATTELLGQILPKPLVLDMVGTDSFLGQSLMKSMFLGGEVPRSGTGDLVKSVLPAWARNLYSDVLGDNLAANVQHIVNQRYIEAKQNGTPFDQMAAFEEAKNQAKAGAVVRLISSGVMGMSGRSVTDGQYYVDQMHQLLALPAATLKAKGYPNAQAAFTAMHPEAARLDWGVSVNETGINATVNAQRAAVKNRSLIEANPDLGWFITGADNVGGQFSQNAKDDQFSQTVYNQQVDGTYGLTQAGRKRNSPEEVAAATYVQQGWDRWTGITDMVKAAVDRGDITAQQASKLKALMAEHVGADNPEWFKEYNIRDDKRATFFVAADKIAAGELADRSDMKSYVLYRKARQEVLDTFGLGSFGGSSANSEAAKVALANVGQSLASRDIGFQQMWDRMLSSEVMDKTTGKIKGAK